MLSIDDRINRQPVQQAELVDFQRCIDDIGVGQLNRKGSQCSIEAIFEKPGASDHSPIIINTLIVKSYLPKPFRLYNVLLHNKKFEQAVKEVWGQQIEGYKMYSVWMKLRRLNDRVMKLNKEMSSLDKKLDNLRKQLKNTQENLDKDPFNTELISEEKELISQIVKWENVNEKVLRQRSRAIWIKEGDQNTKFFHEQLKARKARNRIGSIYNDQGVRITEPRMIEQEFTIGFNDNSILSVAGRR
ncbi:uncharacterized protein [Nicotiana sylvestris]|uniref:uncharacterized protein n=1 Tax=Nicotiana sylvestris TaxID=4096 RepID=UPI00388C3DC6